jgi:protoporphyrinogen oxidase
MPGAPIAVLGTGMAGLGAGYALEASGVAFVCYDKNDYFGGHTRSLSYSEGFVFDEGGHISFTKNEHVKQVFAENVAGAFEEKKLKIDNYWKGHRVTHPPQCHLRGLPTDLIVDVIKDFVSARQDQTDPKAARTYAEWLYMTYGKTFAETFPMVYGHKYHTTTMDRLTTDWIGPRMYRPTLDEILRGALPGTEADVHYVDSFRYPTHGGFESYIRPLALRFDVRLKHQLTGIDARGRLLRFSNGAVDRYSELISSVPLPELIPLIDDVPADVLQAARKLAFTTAVLINIGLRRSDISESAITYFYDPDISISRVNLPHLFSAKNAPPGCGCIQAEIYFSEKYKPFRAHPDDLIDGALRDLRRCDFLRSDDEILCCGTAVNKYANVIYDTDRTDALAAVHGFLDDLGIHYCGRYGQWNHDWTDQAFVDGERTAQKIVGGSSYPEHAR